MLVCCRFGQLREHDKFLRCCHNNKPSFGWLRHCRHVKSARGKCRTWKTNKNSAPTPAPSPSPAPATAPAPCHCWEAAKLLWPNYALHHNAASYTKKKGKISETGRGGVVRRCKCEKCKNSSGAGCWVQDKRESRQKGRIFWLSECLSFVSYIPMATSTTQKTQHPLFWKTFLKPSNKNRGGEKKKLWNNYHFVWQWTIIFHKSANFDWQNQGGWCDVLPGK